VTSKSPSAPPGPLTYEDRDLRRYDDPLFRVHATSGRHPSRWNQFRSWGPTSSRWDPHPLPTGEHPDHGVLYTAADTSTAFGEIFQDDRIIDLHEDDRYLTGWQPLRELILLDLTDTWPLRNGATADLSSAEKETCRAWARAIHTELSVVGPRIDGLCSTSTVTGRPVVTLYRRSIDSLPTAPQLSRTLSHDDLVLIVEQATEDTGFDVVG
jgi:hypothetical protein